MEICYKIKRLREAQRISQLEIAKILGISQKKYSNFESNKTHLSLKQLSILSRKLKINMADLLQDTGIDFYDMDLLANTKSKELVIDNIIDKYENQIKDREAIINLLKSKLTMDK